MGGHEGGVSGAREQTITSVPWPVPLVVNVLNVQ